MTATESLRSSIEFTGRMSELLSDPVLQRGLAALRADGEEDVLDGADALASVRALSRQASRSKTISDLLLLAVPLEVSDKPSLPDFGTGLSQDELAEAYQPA